LNAEAYKVGSILTVFAKNLCIYQGIVFPEHIDAAKKKSEFIEKKLPWIPLSLQHN